MAVRGLVSGRCGCSTRYGFHPLFVSIFGFARFVFIGLFGSWFFFPFFFPSSPSIHVLCGLGVVNCLCL